MQEIYDDVTIFGKLILDSNSDGIGNGAVELMPGVSGIKLNGKRALNEDDLIGGGGSVSFNEVLNTPTTLYGYGITDAAAIDHTHTSQNIVTDLGYTPVNKAGDTMTGSLGIPSSATEGIKTGTTFGWKDLTGIVVPRESTSVAPVIKPFLTNINEYSYSVGKIGDCRYHIPHDYVPGTDLFLHFHWTHNGTAISGSLIINVYASYAKGHNQSPFCAEKVSSVTVSGLNLTNSPQYIHRVDEIQFSTPGGSASMLNTTDIEVDGVVYLSFVVSVIPSITGSPSNTNLPFITMPDIHYQSNNMATKNKSPNFYG